jgi:hypothetical protein
MTPVEQFRRNIERVRHLATLYRTLRGLTTAAVDLADLLRAQLVLAVSALDHLVHDCARTGMLEVYAGQRPPTDAYRRFRVPMSAAAQGLVAPHLADWFDAAIRDAHGWLAFQHPDKIADGVRLYSSVMLWDAVAVRLGLQMTDVKLRLQAIVDRRNKIAHEADLDPTLPGSTWPIDEVLVNEAVSFIEALGEAIVAVA